MVDVIKYEEGLDGVPGHPSTWPMPTYAAITSIFLSSYLLRGLVVDHVVVVDPATNHVGWLSWSLLISLLRWQWWVGLLLHLRPQGPRWFQWVLLGLLAVDAYMTFDSRYSKLIYGDLSAHGYQLMTVLHLCLSLFENAALLLLAVVAARRPLLLPILLFACALKVFISDLPQPANPFAREIFASGLPTVVYLLLATSIIFYLRGRSDREGLLGISRVRRSRPATRSSTPTTTS